MRWVRYACLIGLMFVIAYVGVRVMEPSATNPLEAAVIGTIGGTCIVGILGGFEE